MFSVSFSSVERYINKADPGKFLVPKKRPGSAPMLDEKARKLLEDDLQERPFEVRKSLHLQIYKPSVPR